MVNDNNAKHSTNFTVSIEAAEGVTTGISADDRAPDGACRRGAQCAARTISCSPATSSR